MPGEDIRGELASDADRHGPLGNHLHQPDRRRRQVGLADIHRRELRADSDHQNRKRRSFDDRHQPRQVHRRRKEIGRRNDDDIGGIIQDSRVGDCTGTDDVHIQLAGDRVADQQVPGVGSGGGKTCPDPSDVRTDEERRAGKKGLYATV